MTQLRRCSPRARQVEQASSAEDFFALLGVDYDPKILDVARLHILRRMAQYLASEDFDGVSDDDVVTSVANPCSNAPMPISSRRRPSTSAYSRS